MKKRFTLAKSLMVVALAALLAGCARSPSSRFYTLTPLAAPQAAPSGAAASRLAVDVEPVEIPDYLDRPQIVTRTGSNEVQVAEFDRWAGSLSENMSAVVAEELGLLLGSDRVVVNNGARRGKPDYLVSLRVLRLDCLPGSQVLLKSQWQVSSGDGKKATTGGSSVTERVADTGYGSIVAAINRAVDKVSREIAGEIALRERAAAEGASPP